MLLLGAFLGLAAPGGGMWILAWVGLVPALIWVQRQAAEDVKSVLWGGFCFGLGYHLVYLNWFWGLHPLTWLGFSKTQSLLLAGMAWLLISGMGGLLIALLLEGYRWMSARIPPWWVVFLFPAVWVAGFYVYQYTQLWVPWALLEYTQVGLAPIRWLAGWIGGIGIAYLLVWVNTWLASIMTWRQPGMLMGAPLASLLPALFFLNLHSAVETSAQPPVMPSVMVRQGNLSIEVIRSENLTPEAIRKIYYYPLENTPLSPGTLVALPEEGAITGWVPLQNPLENESLAMWAELAKDKQIHLLMGTATYDAISDKRYNSMVLLSGTGLMQFYHKRVLVPFGEYTPYVNAGWLSDMLATFDIQYYPLFHAGSEGNLLRAPGINVGGLTCFELILPQLSRQYLKSGANVLVNSSNLGWFHGHPWLNHQFLAIGQMRAAENRLPLVIASNTGDSVIVSPEGQVLKRIPAGVSGQVFFSSK